MPKNITLFALILIVGLLSVFVGCGTDGVNTETDEGTLGSTTPPQTAAATTAAISSVPTEAPSVAPMPSTTYSDEWLSFFDPLKLLASVPVETRNQIIETFVDCYNVPQPDASGLYLRVMAITEHGYAVFVDGMMHLDWITSEVVGGLKFTYGSSQKMHFFADGKIYTLTDAYAEGALGDEALKVIYDNYYTAYPHFADETRNRKLPQAETCGSVCIWIGFIGISGCCCPDTAPIVDIQGFQSAGKYKRIHS